MAMDVGARAPDFTLRAADGSTYSLAQGLQGGPVVLVFFKTTCATCDLAFPYINRLADAYPRGGWRLWTIAQDPQEAARDYARRHGIPYPVLPDTPDYAVSRQYDPPSTPTIYLVDPDGRIAFTCHGFSKEDLNQLSGLIAERLGAEAVTIAPPGDGHPDFRPG